MAPPPRPPIICYDLQTNTNLRRAPCTRTRVPVTCATRKTKVTVVPREPNDMRRFAVTPCWYQENLDSDQNENAENILVAAQTTPPRGRKQTISNNNDCYVRVATRSRPRPKLAVAEPYNSNKSSFNRQPISDQQQYHNYQHYEQKNGFNKRYAYGEKLRDEAERKKLKESQELARQNLIREISNIAAELESKKRFLENIGGYFGMGHLTAKKKHDEDQVEWQQKYYRLAESHSRVLGRRAQQTERLRKLQVIEDKKAEDKRMRDMSELAHCRRTLSSTLSNTLNNSQSSSSQTTSNSNSTGSSSSTLSISPCSSLMSIDDRIVESPPSSYKRAKLQPPLHTAVSLTSSTPSRNFLHRDTSRDKSISHKPPDFTFYKVNPDDNETIEVPAMEYFEKAEDSMMDINDLMRKLQTDLKYINQGLGL